MAAGASAFASASNYLSLIAARSCRAPRKRVMDANSRVSAFNFANVVLKVRRGRRPAAKLCGTQGLLIAFGR